MILILQSTINIDDTQSAHTQHILTRERAEQLRAVQNIVTWDRSLVVLFGGAYTDVYRVQVMYEVLRSKQVYTIIWWIALNLEFFCSRPKTQQY